MAGVVDVFEDCGAAYLAGIVDDDVAKTQTRCEMLAETVTS